MPNDPIVLLYAVGILQLVSTMVTGLFIIHLIDKQAHQKDKIASLETSIEISRDRVTYLYDQLSRVETKVDINDKLEEIQEGLEAFQEEKDNRDSGT